MIACVKLSEIWNLLKVKWEGIKWLSQNFHLAFMISMNSSYFQIQDPREKMTWLLPFKNEKGFEKIWISFGNILNLETLSNSMVFMREDKMTSSKHMKYELEVSKNSNLKSLCNYFQFGVIWVLFKLFFSKNKIYGK